MGAEVHAGSSELPSPASPRRSKRKTLRVPVDIVPRKESPSRVKKGAASAADALVERALNADSRHSGPLPILSPPPDNGAVAVSHDTDDLDVDVDVDVTIEMPP